MDTHDMERELAAIFHQRADAAIGRTNTEVERQKFQIAVTEHPRRTRRRRVLVGAAAAVVALVLGVALWPSGPDLEGSSVPAAEVSDSTRAADLAVADGVAAAFAAHNADLLAPYLEPDVSPPISSWATEFMHDAAWGVEYLLEPCAVEESPFFIHSIECPYSVHLLGSREVGSGPFLDNGLSILLKEGKLISAQTRYGWETNGIQPHLDSVMAWVEENNPKNAKFLLMDEQRVAPADWPRWSRLWQRAIADYIVDTNGAG